MSRSSIAIIGGGLAGLSTAHALASRGINATIYEQAPALGEIGAAVGTSPQANKALEEGLELARTRMRGRQGGQVERVDRIADEVSKVAFRQPILQRMGQQELLLGIVGKIARRHLPTTFTTGNRMTARLLPRRLLRPNSVRYHVVPR